MTSMYSPTTVREVLLLLLKADACPHGGSYDWRSGDLMESEALARAGTAVPVAHDPPEFSRWLGTLLQPKLTYHERSAVYFAMQDYFGQQKSAQ